MSHPGVLDWEVGTGSLCALPFWVEGRQQGALDFTYDPVGNRTQMTSTVSALGTGTTSYSYDANDRLSTDTIDANGNTTSSGGVSSGYDFENHMTAYGTTTIVYDGDGNRASETAGGATTKYLVDTVNPTGLPPHGDSS